MNPREDPAFAAMVLDILGSVLGHVSDTGCLALDIAVQIRELTGALCVVLVRCEGGEPRVLEVNPERRREWAESAAADALYRKAFQLRMLTKWRAVTEAETGAALQEAGFELSLAIPLSVGGECLGVLLALGIPPGEANLPSLLAMLVPLARVVALTLNNSLLYQRQDAVIAERTRELEEANQTLRESESKWRAVFENSRDALSVTRLGVHVLTNPAYLAMFGYKDAAELLSRPIMLCIAPSEREIVADMVRRRAAGEAVPTLYETRGMRSDGSEFDMEVCISTYQLGGVTYSLVLNRDITARKQAALERMRLEAELREMQKLESVGRLAGGVAHDFNNLLTVMNGYSNLLLTRPDLPRDARAQVEDMLSAGERAAELTQQLLAFSRKQIIQPKVLALNRVVADAEKMLRRLLTEDIELVTNLEPALWNVMADPGQIHQVLLNLVVNARDAMPKGGRLTISTANAVIDESAAAGHPDAVTGECVQLTVSDTGVGMSEAVRRSVFEPFFTTKGLGHGTGLGLATVYGIVRQSGGCITVESEPGRGATFEICFPRCEQASAGKAEGGVTPAERGHETLLVVEDNESVRKLSVKVLKGYGYRVLDTATGESACELVDGYPESIELLVTDVVLPGIHGRELAERLKRRRPELKVLFISGYTSDVIVHRGVLDEGVTYLPKPFTPAALAGKVREVLGASSGRKY